MFLKESIVFPSVGRSNYRIPTLVIDKHGTAYAFCNDRHDSLADHADEMTVVCARKRPGREWEPVRVISSLPGWQCMIGSAVYDAETDEVMCSCKRIPVARNEFKAYTAEEEAAMAACAAERVRQAGVQPGQIMVYTRDGGETWSERPLPVQPASFIHWDGTHALLDGFCHGAASGIQLQFGAHKGRLLCPSRTQVGTYSTWDGLRQCCYNNAIYSDDHGMRWHASTPVQLATGEGTLIERPDGSILYNSRAFHFDQLRRLAVSHDCGESYGEFSTDDFLRETIDSGCNASLLRVDRSDLRDATRLPAGADGLTLFANPRSTVRENMSICLSYDSGRTWSLVKTVYPGACAYSSLAFSRAEQKFILLYENGKAHSHEYGISAAEFDIDWLLN